MEFILPLTEADLIETSKRLTPDEARQIIKPTSDIFARYLFSSEHLKHLTLSFINAVRVDAGLHPATSVTLKNPFCLGDSAVIKETILDVEVEEPDGVIYDVEIQNKPSEDFFPRIQYYAANLYHKQIHRNEEYTYLRPCMMIALLNGSIYKSFKKPHHYSRITDAESPNFTFFPQDAATYHILELREFDFNADREYTIDTEGTKQRKMAPELFKWMRFLADGARSDFMEAYNEVDLAIEEAKKEYEKFIEDEPKRMAELRHEMWLHDVASERGRAEREGRSAGLAAGLAEGLKKGLKQGLKQGIEQGLKQGIEQGLKQGIEQGIEKGHEEGEHAKALEIATNLQKAGLSIEQIVKCTGLTESEIKTNIQQG